MWKYYLDESNISRAISARMQFKKSVFVVNDFLTSLGFNNENVKSVNFDDLIFTNGSMDEMYSSNEIKFCETVGNIFVSMGNDIFDFFLIDVDENYQFDAHYIGTITKIINKAFKGENIIIFQCKDCIMFASRYISKFAGRDFYFTYWISDVSKIRMFSAYNICRKNQKYSYALYLAMVCQYAVFKHRRWSDKKEDAEELGVNYVSLSKSLSYIVSKQLDSFELLEKALKASEYIKNDSKMAEYRAGYEDGYEDTEMYDEEDLLLSILKE